MNERLARALQEKRATVSKIIQKLEKSEQADIPAASLNCSNNHATNVEQILTDLTTFDDVLRWAKKNFEPSDILLLETKFRKKLALHPEREQDANYCRLLTLIFYLLAANQTAKIYGDFSHRAISNAFSTHLDMYHTLHLLEIACHFADVTLQGYVLKARIADVLATQQDFSMTQDQELALAKLCLFPEDGAPLGDEGPLVDLYFEPEVSDDNQLTITKGDTPKRANLSMIQEAVNNLKKASPGLIQRHDLLIHVDEPGQQTTIAAPYYSPDLALCLGLRKLITVADIRRSGTSVLLDKLTQMWQILLPLHIDIGEMRDFR